MSIEEKSDYHQRCLDSLCGNQKYQISALLCCCYSPCFVTEAAGTTETAGVKQLQPENDILTELGELKATQVEHRGITSSCYL